MILISRKNLIIAGLVWGISLAVFLLVYVFVLKPQKAELMRIDAKLKEKEKEANDSQGMTAESKLQNLRKQIEEFNAQLGEFVIKSKDEIQTLASLEIYNMSQEIGLDAFHIDPWSGVEVAAFSECKQVFGQTMIVGFNAGFPEFAKFINMLERYKTVIFIDSFSITRSTDESGKHKVDMNLAVLVEKPASTKGNKS